VGPGTILGPDRASGIIKGGSKRQRETALRARRAKLARRHRPELSRLTEREAITQSRFRLRSSPSQKLSFARSKLDFHVEEATSRIPSVLRESARPAFRFSRTSHIRTASAIPWDDRRGAEGESRERSER